MPTLTIVQGVQPLELLGNMKKLKLYHCFLMAMIACSPKQNEGLSVSVCNKTTSREIADREALRLGYSKDAYFRTDEVSQEGYFAYTYSRKDSSIIGGGALVKIDKENCNVIEVLRYQ